MMNLPRYKERDGIRVFDTDFKVDMGDWMDETVECASVLKYDYENGYYYVKAYSLSMGDNNNLRHYFQSIGGRASGYSLLRGASLNTGVNFID